MVTVPHQAQAGPSGGHCPGQARSCRYSRIRGHVACRYCAAGAHQEHEDGLGKGNVLKCQCRRDVGFQHYAFVYLGAVLHLEEFFLGLSVFEAVVEVEIGGGGKEPSHIMEVGTLTEVNQIHYVRALRLAVIEELGRILGLSAEHHYVSYAYVCLLALTRAGFCKFENAALLQRQSEHLVGPGAVHLGVQDKSVVRIHQEAVLVQNAVVGEGAGGEGNVVELSCKVKCRKGRDVIVEKGCACCEDKALIELFSAHGEGIMRAFSCKISTVVTAHSTYAERLDGRSQRGGIGQI